VVADLLEHCAHLPHRRVTAGTTLIEQGDRFGQILVLLDGTVDIERDGQSLAVVDSPGAVLGEMSTVLDRPATATVRARTDTEVLVAEDGIAFLVEHPEVVLEVARTLATRLDNLTGHLADVKRQYGDSGSHLGMLDEVMSTLMHHQTPAVRSGSARQPEPDL
jgi:CRP-like cAMP-binding protein